MDEVLKAIFKVLVAILAILKKGVDWALTKSETCLKDTENKIAAKPAPTAALEAPKAEEAKPEVKEEAPAEDKPAE